MGNNNNNKYPHHHPRNYGLDLPAAGQYELKVEKRFFTIVDESELEKKKENKENPSFNNG